MRLARNGRGRNPAPTCTKNRGKTLSGIVGGGFCAVCKKRVGMEPRPYMHQE